MTNNACNIRVYLVPQIHHPAEKRQFPEKAVEKAPPKKHRVCLIKDLRFFFNTLERSLDLLAEAGFLVEKQQSEGDEAFEISLRIGKQKQEHPR